MPEVIVFPDVEALLVSYLNTSFAAMSGYTSVRASTKPPKDRPSKFVVVRRTGGTSDLVVDNAQITVEAWANKATDAMALMQRVRGLLHAIDRVSGVQFYRPVEFSGPANLPDPDSEQERYTETFSVGVRGSAL